MKITQVYITLDTYRFEPSIRSKYQFLSNYLTLFISDWLKKFKLDLGNFNRLIFREGNDQDLSVVGDRAFVICLREEFNGPDSFNNEEESHDYFVKKYLEGFNRLDSEFDLDLTSKISVIIEKKFNDCLNYEIKIKSKKIDDLTIQAFHRYRYDIYELVIRVLDVNKNIIKDDVIFKCDPDPFVVHYEVNKIYIDECKVRVVNKIREEIITHSINKEH